MNDKLKKLEEMGCDVEGAMNRFLKDEAFYEECYEKVLQDVAFEKLGEALRAHEIREAFDQAHSLKGVLANLGLTSLLERVTAILEPLRLGKDDGLLVKYDDLLREREKYQAL